MKKLIPLLILVGAVASHAQDWEVNFNNANLPSTTAHPDRLVRFSQGGPGVVGTNYQAVLLYGTSASSLNPAGAPARFRVSTTSTPGTWQGGLRTLTGIGNTPGTVVQMQVAVFDINQFATYALAAAGGGILGRSSVFTYTIPAPPLGPDAQDLLNFDGFVIPEPSVIGLGLVGAAALFLLRRRKAA